MSRLHRAVEKADREGLLTWTRGGEDRTTRATALVDPPVAPRDEPAPFTSPTEPFAPAEPSWAPDTPVGGIINDLLVAATDPGSAAAEQYRLLRTKLEGEARRTQLLLVTSPRIGDGKTTTSANLALTMAQEFQQKVVLVEADLRRPRLAEQFGVRGEPGLADVLVGAAALEDSLVPVPGHHLYLLPAGPAAARSTELLASPVMQRVIAALRARFNRIVLDTAPAAMADTHVLARLADGVLVVVRSGITPRPALERTLAGIDRQKLLGIVLNEVEDAPDDYASPGAYLRGASE